MRKRDRIYILPTKMGDYFNGLIFLLFLLSVGYSNNLLLIFTLFLFGLNLLWVIQTHYHLRELKLEHLHIEEGHAKDTIPFSLTWKSSPPGPHQWEVILECDKGKIKLNPLVQDTQQTLGELKWNRRGIWNWKILSISTQRPFGLYYAWRHLQVKGQSHAYPKLTNTALASPLKGLGLEGDAPSGLKGAGDWSDFLPYSNEEARKISWKHYASKGELLVKEGEDLKAPMAIFKWAPDETDDKEERLSALATQMVICHRESIPFTFEINGTKRGPLNSARHLSLCLQDLSLC